MIAPASSTSCNRTRVAFAVDPDDELAGIARLWRATIRTAADDAAHGNDEAARWLATTAAPLLDQLHAHRLAQLARSGGAGDLQAAALLADRLARVTETKRRA